MRNLDKHGVSIAASIVPIALLEVSRVTPVVRLPRVSSGFKLRPKLSSPLIEAAPIRSVLIHCMARRYTGQDEVLVMSVSAGSRSPYWVGICDLFYAYMKTT
jgi:hypothetical protein